MQIRKEYYPSSNSEANAIYEEGVKHLFRNEFRLAKENFESLISTGHLSAIFNLAGLLSGGATSPVDIRKAHEYYKLAAGSGHELSSKWNNLIEAYSNNILSMSYFANVLLPRMQLKTEYHLHPLLPILLLISLEKNFFDYLGQSGLVLFLQDIEDPRVNRYIEETGISLKVFRGLGEENSDVDQYIRNALNETIYVMHKHGYQESHILWLLCVTVGTMLGINKNPSISEFDSMSYHG